MPPFKLSLPKTGIVTGVPFGVVALSLFATGVGVGQFTITLTEVIDEPDDVTNLYVKLSVPQKPALGV